MVEATPGLVDVLADFFEAAMPDIAAKALKELAPRELHIISPNKAPRIIPRAHHALQDVVEALQAGVRPFLVGPAGSGKTTLARQCAEALDVPFYMSSRISHESKLMGHMDGYGNYHTTQYRKAFETGGVFLLDEVAAGEADVLTSFNASLENGHGDFPDAAVPAHADFYPMAADNTYGEGGDRIYVGRNQLDGATTDRFVFLEIGYDEILERELAQNDAWVDRVHQIRRAVAREGLHVIVSPRASIAGAKLLQIGWPQPKVEEAVLFKGMNKASRARVDRAY